MALMAVPPPVRVLFFLIVLVKLIDSHHVPVFIWGSKSHSQLSNLPSQSHVTADQFKENYLKPIKASNSKCTLIVFVQDRLSLEDMSMHGNGLTPVGPNYVHLQNFMDTHPFVTLQSVEDPMPVIRDVKDYQTIHAKDYNDDIRSLLAESKSRVLLVNLPSTVATKSRPDALKASDEMMSKGVSHFGNKCYVAIFTGKEPSWDAASEEASHRRIARSLLATEESNTTTFAIYMESIRVKIVDANGKYNVTNATLPEPTITFDNVNKSRVYESTWTFGSTPIFERFVLDMTFMKAPTYWIAKDITASFTKTNDPDDPQTVSVKANNDITAGNGFSFSCSNTVLKGSKNATLYTLYVTLHNFQIEPFSTQNLTAKGFSDSYHCSTFFTLPLWMGFFTLLLFTIILSTGIFMLFQVKTTDRFDDPKGKTITVPQSE